MTSSPLRHPRKARGRTLSHACTAALAIASVSALAANAEAQTVDCTTLPNAILGIGGSAATNLIKRIGTRLAGATPPITVVYSDPGACQAMTALVPSATAPAAALTGTGKYWDASGKEQTCTYPSGSNTQADWGAMAQEPSTCSGVTTLPSDVGDFLGPISGFSLIVPKSSTEYAISAEAVYYIYGYGAGTGHDVAPWTVPGAIGSRTTTSAAGLLLAKAVGLSQARPLAYLPTNDVKTNQGAVDFITATSAAAVANPNAALAFASTETADANRAKVRTLAFKALGQECAYGPDTEVEGPKSTDKKNLREGRYYLWNVHHFFAKVDATSKRPVKPALATFIDIVTSTTELPATATSNESFLDLQIANGNVPQCAMRVTRTGDMGPLASFSPAAPCGCYFDNKTTNTTTCKSCSTSAECPSSAPLCSAGFCEVK